MAVDEPSPPRGSAPAGVQQQTPAEHAGADILDIEKEAASAKMGGPGGREWTQPERDLLDDWAGRVTAAQHAHYYLMTRLRRKNMALGLPVVILSAVVGTALFASVANQDAKIPSGVRLLIGSISVLAAVLAGVQTFLKFSERAEQHGLAADWLAAVRRDIDLMRATPEPLRGDPREALTGLRKEINKIAQNAPGIGEKVWHDYAGRYGVKEPLEG
jgi:hypothetical protein